MVFEARTSTEFFPPIPSLRTEDKMHLPPLSRTAPLLNCQLPLTALTPGIGEQPLEDEKLGSDRGRDFPKIALKLVRKLKL